MADILGVRSYPPIAVARLFPTLSSCRNMQAGERRFAERLLQYLEDDYLIWYDQPVGRRRRYPDFVILHPRRGLLLLEVKDWRLETLQRIDRDEATLLVGGTLKRVASPLAQARQCLYQLKQMLEADPQLRQPDGPRQGQLICPYAHGVVFTRISRRAFDATDLPDVLPPRLTLCKDEMTPSLDAEAFQQRLWDMFDYPCHRPLSLPQIDRIRWHLYPEVRVAAAQTALFPEPTAAASAPDPASASTSEPAAPQAPVQSIPDLVRVMDLQQEQLARSLGSGHRVIHGVAGAGKTLILVYRALHLAQAMHKPVLILCFNLTLAAHLRTVMAQHGVAERVQVRSFHAWCRAQLQHYHVPLPPGDKDFYAELPACTLAAVERGVIPRSQYGAVLIDEGHDFAPDWLRLAVSMVDEQTDSLLLLYDDAQAIYRSGRHGGGLDFTLSSVGVRAQGRTNILRINYRNTEEILQFAYRFARQYIAPSETDEDHVPTLEPQGAGRRGTAPVVRLQPDFPAEVRLIARTFAQLHRRDGVPLAQMCVTYRHQWMGERLGQALAAQGLACQHLHDAGAKRTYDPCVPAVKLMTMHSSKGLEFPVVAVAGVGAMPADEGSTPAEEARLLYVALTRATDKLLVTAHRPSPFFAALAQMPMAAGA